MSRARIRWMTRIGIAAMVVLGTAAAANAFFCGWGCCGGAGAASPVCCTTPAPYHAGRMLWTPSYGITSTCNPLAAQTCGYGFQSAAVPAGACSPCGPCGVAAAPVATTTFRPFLWGLFRPLMPTTTYRVAFCAPTVPCAPACPAPCAPVCAPACPTSCAPACDPCGAMAAPALGAATSGYDTIAPGGCPGGNCAPVITQTPTTTYQPAPPVSAPSSEPSSIVPRTFEDPQPAPSPDLRMRPTPDTNTDQSNPSSGAPRLIDPVARKLARPIHQATYQTPVSRPQPARPVPASVQPNVTKPAPSRTLDVGGWRASRK